ncbi:ribonuclease H-like domain-containing protein [Tanacetum coccineum]
MSVPVNSKKDQQEDDVKARSLLLWLFHKELHRYFQFNSVMLKQCSASIKTRFGGNEATKKTQKTLLKQQYENFSGSSTVLSENRKKIFINANDTAGYDKAKVECFNCHKMGHFARECRAPRNKEGFDWSDMAEEQVQTNMALMAFSDSEDSKQKSNIVCDKKSDDSKENSDDSLVKEQVLEDTSSFVKSSLNVDKETIFLDKKIDYVKANNHEKTVKKSVRLVVNTIKGKGWTVNTVHPKSIVFSAKSMSRFSKSAQSTVRRPYQSKTVLSNKRFTQTNNTAITKVVNTARPKAVNTARPHSIVVNAVRVNQSNAVKASACWVWRPTKLDSASITLKKHNYIDARGRSKPVMDWVPKGN